MFFMFLALNFWPAILLIFLILIGISYAYRKHRIGQYSLYFFVCILSIFLGVTLYIYILISKV